MSELIKSRQNQIVRHIKALHNKKYREEYRQFFVEGIKLTKEAVLEQQSIAFFLISEEFDCTDAVLSSVLNSDKIKSYKLSQNIFDDVSDCSTPQGIIAVINKKDTRITDVFDKPEFFLGVLDEVRDPGNVGTILRTLEAAGADGLVLLGGCADPYSPKTVRSTMGSIYRVPVFEIEDTDSFFDNLKSLNTHIMVGHIQGEDLFGWQGGFIRTAVVIGNESKGVNQTIRERASSTVAIPMCGNTESLNAATAAALMIYEVYRKKHYC